MLKDGIRSRLNLELTTKAQCNTCQTKRTWRNASSKKYEIDQRSERSGRSETRKKLLSIQLRKL
jgi:hypothetical protein